MNYYPNTYPYMPMSQMPMPQQQISLPQPPPPQPQQTILNGKMVESIDVAKVTDVPFGGYGFFPRADLEEVYIKSWNPNGTTSIKVYKLDAPQDEDNPVPPISLAQISEKIDNLEQKLSSLYSSIVTNQNSCEQQLNKTEEKVQSLSSAMNNF